MKILCTCIILVLFGGTNGDSVILYELQTKLGTYMYAKL